MAWGRASACSEEASLCSGSCPSDRFIADLLTASDRSMALLMQLGGLRASEVRLLPLAKLILVCGGSGLRARAERNAWCRSTLIVHGTGVLPGAERPAGGTAGECFEVLNGPTIGHA